MNKSTYVIFLFILMISVPVIAQHQIGFVGGLNFATFDIDEGEYEARTLFGVGGVVDLSLNEKFILHIEPMYLQKGGTQTDSDPEGRLKLSYLEIPVFLKYEFGSRIKPYLFAGPSVGYLLSSEIKFESGGTTLSGNIKSVTKSFDLGLGSGVGISFPLGVWSIFLEGRYTIGLSDINKGGDAEFSSEAMSIQVEIADTNAKNRGFQLMLGMTFPLGNK